MGAQDLTRFVGKYKVDTRQHKGFHFPKYDQDCHRVVFDEQYKIEEVLKYCLKTRVAVQAGGNVGLFPLRMASYFEKVYTFEPDPDNYHCMMLNLEEREVPNIEVKWAGLGDKNTTGRMNRPWPSNCGANEVVPGFGIDIVALDSVLDFDAEVDLIYLDIEGAEHKALLGSKNIIDKCKPVIVVENKGLIPGFPSNHDGSQAFRDWICSLGYIHELRLMRDDVFVPA